MLLGNNQVVMCRCRVNVREHDIVFVLVEKSCPRLLARSNFAEYAGVLAFSRSTPKGSHVYIEVMRKPAFESAASTNSAKLTRLGVHGEVIADE